VKKIALFTALLFVQFLGFAQKENTIVTTSTSLKYKIITQGSGSKPLITDKVTFHYKGTLEDGTVFDDSYKRGTALEVLPSNMIKGMQEGLTLMPLGSKYIFYIPSNLAYGAQGAGSVIKPNANVIFEVELLKINGDDGGVKLTNEVTENQNSKPDYKEFRTRGFKYLNEEGNYKQALAYAEKALSIKPMDPLSLSLRGMAKESLDDIDGALQDYNTVINKLGNEADVLFYRRGILHEIKNDYALAKADYEKVLKLKPDFKKAIEAQERIKNKEYNEAMKKLNESLDKSLQAVNSIDPNRPFMKLITSTNQEIAVCTKRGKEIAKEIDNISDKSLSNSTYNTLNINLQEEINKVYRLLMRRSKELEAFNDAKWPIFKAEYRKLLVNSGIDEKYLKDF
jgi:tetratricopeptide (TPR) repeat protein